MRKIIENLIDIATLPFYLIRESFKSKEQKEKEFRFMLWAGLNTIHKFEGIEGVRDIVFEVQKEIYKRDNR